VIQLPANEDVIKVRVIDAQRAGVVVVVRVYDRHTRSFLRTEQL
jgi:hypothetical protein